MLKNSVFNPPSLDQQVAKAMLDYSKNPQNEALKDECIRLTINCGKFHLKNNDLTNAEKYFAQAKKLAGDTHSRSLDISTCLLEIAEKAALSSGTAAAIK